MCRSVFFLFFFQWTFWRVSTWFGKLNEMSLALVMLELKFFFLTLEEGHWNQGTTATVTMSCVCC